MTEYSNRQPLENNFINYNAGVWNWRLIFSVKRIILLVCSVVFLSTSCSLFPSQPIGIGGLTKTVNGGADWQAINTVKGTSVSNLGTLSFDKILIDPQNRQVLYAGSISGGLYRSEDAGSSWEIILSKMYVWDFVVDSQSPHVLYAAGNFGNEARIVKSPDNGATWQEIYNQQLSGETVRAIALNPQNNSQLVAGTASGNLILSNDSGLSWKLLKNFNDKINQISWQNGYIYLLLKTKGLYKGLADGSDFTSLTANLLPTSSAAIYIGSSVVDSLNQFYVDSLTPSLVYLTTDKGLYKTINEGQAWTLVPLPTTLPDLGVWAVEVSSLNSSSIYVSVGGNIYKSTDGGNNWQTQQVGGTNLVYDIAIDPVIPQITYASIFILNQ